VFQFVWKTGGVDRNHPSPPLVSQETGAVSWLGVGRFACRGPETEMAAWPQGKACIERLLRCLSDSSQDDRCGDRRSCHKQSRKAWLRRVHRCGLKRCAARHRDSCPQLVEALSDRKVGRVLEPADSVSTESTFHGGGVRHRPPQRRLLTVVGGPSQGWRMVRLVRANGPGIRRGPGRKGGCPDCDTGAPDFGPAWNCSERAGRVYRLWRCPSGQSSVRYRTAPRVSAGRVRPCRADWSADTIARPQGLAGVAARGGCQSSTGGGKPRFPTSSRSAIRTCPEAAQWKSARTLPVHRALFKCRRASVRRQEDSPAGHADVKGCLRKGVAGSEGCPGQQCSTEQCRSCSKVGSAPRSGVENRSIQH